MRLAVLGGSHGGFTTAADLALAGHRVRLWARSKEALGPLLDEPTLMLFAEGRQGSARLDRATTDLAEAVEGAEVLIAPLPATSHDELAKRLAPHVNERQIVLLTPGTLGSLALARGLARAGVRAANLPTGVFPASRTDAVLARLAELFPAMRRCADALDVALTNAGPVIHPPLVLLNTGPIDGGRFDIHVQGTTATVRRLIDAVDAERVATRRGWGYPAPHYELATYYDEARAAEGFYGAGARGRVAQSRIFDETLGLEHRYVTEDVVLGLSLLESAARAAGVATPATTGLLLVFGVLLGRELSGDGRALEHLGLGDLSRREIRVFLEEGWASQIWRKVVQ
ncbi:MAG: glycerol-3-phosphate dehydrogenase [Candidatus Rokuibacteriota bacterium]|nr:MAG: glycerol-3-phosphate dehydrogenase [Candidatus Rokubacteria bacterium]